MTCQNAQKYVTTDINELVMQNEAFLWRNWVSKKVLQSDDDDDGQYEEPALTSLADVVSFKLLSRRRIYPLGLSHSESYVHSVSLKASQ